MKKILLIFFLTLIQNLSLASSCPDGSEPEKKVSDDGTYFIFECAESSSNNQSQGKIQSSHRLDTPANWPGGIKHATESSANAILYFDEAKKPERLYINSSDRPPHNVAYTGNIEIPISYYGFWPKGAYSKYIPTPYEEKFIEKFVYEQEIDEIVDGNDHAQRGNDNENKEVFSYHLQMFHNGNRESLETLKSLMFEWVNGPYWKAMIPDRELACTSCSNEQPIWEGYNFSIMGELWNTLVPMLEVHITLIRENVYSKEEYDLVHNWLEKRVWLGEQGPAEGQLAAAHRWIPDPGPPNHHKKNKVLAYLMWGIADQNSEYFTAGVRGVDQYHNVLRDDGSIKTEHFYDKACQTGFGDHGCRNGLTLGNETGRFYTLAALLMHNQGIDIRKKYPKIEKNIEWTTQVAVDPASAMNWIGSIFVEENRGSAGDTFSKEGIVMDWARNWAPQRKNLAHIYLWDKIFETNYSDNLKGVFVVDLGIYQEEFYDHIVRRAFDFGIADTGLITFNSDEVSTGMMSNGNLALVDEETLDTEIKSSNNKFSIAFSNSTDSGDYIPSSEELFLDNGSSEKFTIQALDCDVSSSRDCDSNTQRLLMIEKDGANKQSSKLYEWSMFIPKDNQFPQGAHLKYNLLGMPDSDCEGANSITFMEFENGLRISLFGGDESEEVIIKSKNLRDKWHQFKLEVSWSESDTKGHVKLIINDIFTYEYQGQTLKCGEVSFMYGLIRAKIKNSTIAKSTPSSVYFDSIKISKIDSSNPSIFLDAKLGKTTKKIQANNTHDGQYTFRLYTSSEDGNVKLGHGSFDIKNGVIHFNKKKKSSLHTGSIDYYKTLEAKISENGEVSGSIKLDILDGVDRSEVYNLSGPIKKIWGESPKEDFLKIYLSVKKAKKRTLDFN